MNIDGLNIANTFATHKSKDAMFDIKQETMSFAKVLDKSIEEKSSAANNPSKLTSSKKTEDSENNIRLSGQEDKYCSLCGSMIDEEGNCPLCIVPIFIHGNQQAQGQNVSSLESAHPIAKGISATASNKSAT